MSPPDLTLFGMGYVGTVLAVGFARHGLRVAGVETSPAKRGAFAAGRLPFEEPGLSDAFLKHRDQIRISGTLAEAGLAPISMICVGTPRDPATGACDARAVFACLREIGAYLKSRSEESLILIRSTLWPGLWHACLESLEEACGRPPGSDVRLGAYPEFMREGSSLEDFDAPILNVLGVDDDKDARRVAALCSFLAVPPLRVSPIEALLLKYVCNAFHAMKVGFANEVSACATAFGVDSRRLMELFCRDTRLNLSSKYLRPGLPFGGSCLPKDVAQLGSWARESKVSLPLLENLGSSNAAHTERLTEAIARRGFQVVAFVGLTFKAGVDDLRGSPVVELIQRLASRGIRTVGIDRALRPERLVDQNRALYDRLIATRGFSHRVDLDGSEEAVFFAFDTPEARALFARVPTGVQIFTFFEPPPEMPNANRV